MAIEVFKMKERIFYGVFFFVIICSFGTAANIFAEEPAAENLSLELRPQEIISMEELRELRNKKMDILIFDARSKEAYDQGHIQGAVLPLPMMYYQEKQLLAAGVISRPFDANQSLAEAMKEYPRGIPIVTYCNNNCKASAGLLRRLQKIGFTNIRSMEAGYQS